jgi:hypothetical protein
MCGQRRSGAGMHGHPLTEPRSIAIRVVEARQALNSEALRSIMNNVDPCSFEYILSVQYANEVTALL